MAELCEKLGAMRGRGEMVELVAGFLRGLQPAELEPAVSMILGRAFPRWSQKTLDISWAALYDVIRRLTQVEHERFAKAFDKTGDLGAAAAMVFESSKVRRQAALIERPLGILDVSWTFDGIAEARGPGARERKKRLLEALLGNAVPLEVKYLVKIIVGEMRTGFQEGLMELAVARAFDLPQKLVQRAAMFVGDVADVARVARKRGEEGVAALRPQVLRPIQPMLAQSVDSIREALKIHGGEAAFEHKLDGARVQIHKSDDVVRIFSRRLTDVTESLPEVVRRAHGLQVREAILEGEIIALDKQGKPLPFQYLMQRFRREREIKQMMQELPVGLYLFDIIFLDGVSLVDLPYHERRAKLAEVADGIPLIEQLTTSNVGDAERFLDDALRAGHEGLMAKRLDGHYTPGLRGKLWLKVKPVLEPLDLVIVAAEYGYGRRHEWLSDYYLAARDAETGEFLIVGKTFKGLTDREIVEMTERLKELTVKREGRRVIVTPKIVVEVAYNEVQRSPKYKCGMALRFARVTRVREDKGPEEADTIQRVREIYQGQVKKH
ncbi:MAG: ATP-dependent DNA ligase [Candidatus Hodarchaeaceae archaeon]|nr:ATP-dependent DNA ligase [Candidatus Hodarchaeaceae archaeon]